MGINVGDVLGDEFRVDAKVGEGGMGIVYRGWQLSLDRPVAVKVLKLSEADDPDEALDYFTREGVVLGSVGKHPSITDVYYKGLHDGLPYLVMEWAEGEPLDKVIEREGLFSETRALRIVVSICEALVVAHAKELVHRDLKTDNVMLLPDESIRLLDFGLARLFTPSTRDPRRKKTETGTIKGTIRCMSPEQAGGRELDHRTDLFSLGVILCELLTGHRPYDELHTLDSEGGRVPLAPVQIAIKIVSGEPPLNVKVYRPDVSDAVAALIDKAMAFDREARFQSASEMKYAVVQCLLDRVQAVPAKPTDRTIQGMDVSHDRPTVVAQSGPVGAPASGRRLVLILAGALAIAAAGVVGTMIVTARRTGASLSSTPVVAVPVSSAPSTQAVPVAAPPVPSPTTTPAAPPASASKAAAPVAESPKKSAPERTHTKKPSKPIPKDGTMDPFGH